jgi:hypothetical protein
LQDTTSRTVLRREEKSSRNVERGMGKLKSPKKKKLREKYKLLKLQ